MRMDARARRRFLRAAVRAFRWVSPPSKILPSLQEGTPQVSASEDRVPGGLPGMPRGSREEPSRGGFGTLLLRGGIVESNRHLDPLINPSTVPMSRVVARRPCCF